MHSLLDLLNKSTTYLEGKGVEKARLNAELIFAHVLQCKRLDLFLHFDKPVLEAEADAIRPLIVRRGKREPLQYITGSTHFYDLEILCDSRCLIPRPETEELVELLVDRLSGNPPKAILDLGTGTGCLGLALAKTFAGADVTLVDASPEALSLAKENAEHNGLMNRINYVHSDWLAALGGEAFDLIVSNPPYLTGAEWDSAAPEVRKHEPEAALVGRGEGGTGDLLSILSAAKNHIKSGGLLALETGIAQHEMLMQHSAKCGYKNAESLPDLSKRNRFFLAQP